MLLVGGNMQNNRESYSLIAKEIGTNNIKIIKLFDNKVKYRLIDIDVFTYKFNDTNQFIDYLYINKYISNKMVDIYIVNDNEKVRNVLYKENKIILFMQNSEEKYKLNTDNRFFNIFLKALLRKIKNNNFLEYLDNCQKISYDFKRVIEDYIKNDSYDILEKLKDYYYLRNFYSLYLEYTNNNDKTKVKTLK